MEILKARTSRVIITVLGKDQLGIIAWVSGRLAEQNVNILDISQTILQEFFTMIMIVDLATSTLEVAELAATLSSEGRLRGLQVNVQHEDVFAYMHRI
ncbi:MAG TPA: ACT domain-containing protein [Desulfitobacteriaceae bacterium]|nr:ACT domain-containing protein [Desulfitobacteriaceae bacterium]